MTAKSPEEMEKRLGETERKLQHEIERLQAARTCENLMSKYEYLCSHGRVEEVMKCFALKTPGLRVEMVWGVYEGIEGVERLYLGFHRKFGQDPGSIVVLTNTTCVIEVAGDGKTAKAIWYCPGLGAGVAPDGKAHSSWGWAKRAADFVKEDGEWKIWHYHVYGLTSHPYEKSWVEGCVNITVDTIPDDYKPDGPPTTDTMYDVTKVDQYLPVVPEPYETFDERDAY